MAGARPTEVSAVRIINLDPKPSEPATAELPKPPETQSTIADLFSTDQKAAIAKFGDDMASCLADGKMQHSNSPALDSNSYDNYLHSQQQNQSVYGITLTIPLQGGTIGNIDWSKRDVDLHSGFSGPNAVIDCAQHALQKEAALKWVTPLVTPVVKQAVEHVQSWTKN
jgi:hypothetical protein